MTIIKALHFSEPFDSCVDANDEPLTILEGLSPVNILVGPNNSGKSRLLRAIGTTIPEKMLFQSHELDAAQSSLSATLERMAQALRSHNVTAVGQVGEGTLSQMPTLAPFDSPRDPIAELKRFFTSRASGTIGSVLSNERHAAGSVVKKWQREAGPMLKILADLNSPASPTERVYIPVLRGLRRLSSGKDVYRERTYQDYFSDKSAEKTIQIWTGLDFYDKVRSLLLGDYSARQKITEYEQFLSREFFEQQRVSLIPKEQDDVLHIKIGDEKEQPLYLLGDGLQSIIIMTLPMFLLERAVFCIEEPELYLHPGMQKRILDIFASQSQHLFFATTHSNHFLDMSMDTDCMSIYQVRKRLADEDGREKLPTFRVEQVNRGDRSVLAALGVRNSSVFLVNATIWVEGITDRWYFRKFLELYQEDRQQQDESFRRMEEGTHFSFVEYGGSAITHWSFLDEEDKPVEITRLCGRALLISDSDGEKKKVRKAKLEAFLEDRYLCLQVREVENLLPPRIISTLVRQYEKDPSLALPEFKHEDYRDEYLGTYIKDVLLEGNQKRSGAYAADSGTVTQKRKFCTDALALLTPKDLSGPMYEIAKQMYDFIAKQN